MFLVTFHILSNQRKIRIRIPTRFEFDMCELKEESTFAECPFGEVPPHHLILQKAVVILFFSYLMIHLCWSV